MKKWTHRVTCEEEGWIILLNDYQWQELDFVTGDLVVTSDWAVPVRGKKDYLLFLKGCGQSVKVEMLKPLHMVNK